MVNNYANSIKDNFKSSINIETNVLKTNDMSVDYKKTSQGTIVNKVKSLFSMIGKNVFKNGNQEIYVSNKDIKESIEKTLKNPSQKNLLNENMAVFSQLDKIIENGQKISDSQDTKGRENYRDWEYYVTPIVIDGKNYIVEFDTVFNADDNKRHFRLERVYDLEQTKTGLSTDFQTNSFTPRIGNNPALESTTNGILTPDFVNSSDNNIAQSDTTVNNSNMQDTENNTDENLYETMEDDTPDILMVEDAKTKNQPYLPKIKEASPKVETVTRTIDEKSTESKKQEAVTMLKDLINNSDSKVSSTHLDNLLNKYDLDYNKIYEEATKKPTRAEVNRKYNEKAEKFIQNTMAWKDKKTGFQYATETWKRNLYDVMPKSDADAIYKEYFQPISEHEAEAKRYGNQLYNKLIPLKLNAKESTAVQMLGEYKYNPKTTLTSKQVNEFIEQNKLDKNKIEKSLEPFRKICGELFVKINESLSRNGYVEIPKREGYFPHFTEKHGNNIITKTMEKLGWRFTDDHDLPTDIAGMTGCN